MTSMRRVWQQGPTARCTRGSMKGRWSSSPSAPPGRNGGRVSCSCAAVRAEHCTRTSVLLQVLPRVCRGSSTTEHRHSRRWCTGLKVSARCCDSRGHVLPKLLPSAALLLEADACAAHHKEKQRYATHSVGMRWIQTHAGAAQRSWLSEAPAGDLVWGTSFWSLLMLRGGCSLEKFLRSICSGSCLGSEFLGLCLC